jgi:hypothetical protein
MSVALSLLPVVLLLAALMLGRYPGERVLGRVLARRAPRRRRAPRGARSHAPAPFLLVRGGPLVGARLAGRAPPWLVVPT